MIVAVLWIHDVDRLLSAKHPFDEEGIDDRALLGGVHHERAGVKVVAEVGVREGGGQRHGQECSDAADLRYPPRTTLP